ncbi:fumarylacetoacetate (FAA) hydrolase [Bacteroides coprosuis DSM 18011]|uniref:Fumarylacetoacetate (FAA) hydrolase n=1 Tax=Bacteroides coprosuis DSM 18011 TaxID=679937 RepID=F3ZPN1_9BACE|nr:MULTISPECIES: fumarylacetoacetate hydrolase family protein [Bacteroides]EGJ70390.1 fumarylacetoacetate (FAA) hydrolase [Bacteroides coprosuis DSM 18011]
MKIICLGRNYASLHKDGLNTLDPFVFLKPDSALLKDGKPFFLPDFSSNFKYEGELVFHINRLGKNISERFAHRYYDKVTVGLDLAAEDILSHAKEHGLPWDLSKGFDSSAVIGDFIPVANLNLENLRFSLNINKQTVQRGNANEMVWSIDQIIAYVSRFYTLKIGDLIFTGTPEGAGKLDIGQHFDGFIENNQVLSLDIR